MYKDRAASSYCRIIYRTAVVVTSAGSADPVLIGYYRDRLSSVGSLLLTTSLRAYRVRIYFDGLVHLNHLRHLLTPPNSGLFTFGHRILTFHRIAILSRKLA